VRLGAQSEAEKSSEWGEKEAQRRAWAKPALGGPVGKLDRQQASVSSVVEEWETCALDEVAELVSCLVLEAAQAFLPRYWVFIRRWQFQLRLVAYGLGGATGGRVGRLAGSDGGTCSPCFTLWGLGRFGTGGGPVFFGAGATAGGFDVRGEGGGVRSGVVVESLVALWSLAGAVSWGGSACGVATAAAATATATAVSSLFERVVEAEWARELALALSGTTPGNWAFMNASVKASVHCL